jgi:hypothetical protein
MSFFFLLSRSLASYSNHWNINITFIDKLIIKYTTQGRAMAQAVSRQPLTEEARVDARDSPGGICGG